MKKFKLIATVILLTILFFACKQQEKRQIKLNLSRGDKFYLKLSDQAEKVSRLIVLDTNGFGAICKEMDADFGPISFISFEKMKDISFKKMPDTSIDVVRIKYSGIVTDTVTFINLNNRHKK